ncbi:ABC transporter ATP-binding protein [Aciduricibacillus chroicocephali]|uniref:ABC transporter ATP-binding protein n=1 Tax=Aciduricibacillus chroicocephali TaxID=3054939 RepID=A0ABY9KWG1_9BACI|nr:ABC transporter ATP-binding protein [Bacillaceae bacterium 44XB]
MTEKAMELVDVRKSIGRKEIIKGITFTINKGEVFGFIGPNGAGKTTTIRMMVGLMKLSGGEIRICGKSIKSEYKEAAREIGAIVENPELYPFMTGWQNLVHFSRMQKGVTKERIKEVVELVGLGKAMKEKVGKYSLGMRQRLGIAQALLHKPSVLILDEPTNGLDPAGIREMRQHIRNLAEKENVAVIISSHLLSEIELMCDRVGLIQNGKMVAVEAVREAEKPDVPALQDVILEAVPLEKTRSLLFAYDKIEAKAEGDLLRFKCPKERLPEIVAMLVRDNIAIYQVGAGKATLEEKFFDLIGENTIV